METQHETPRFSYAAVGTAGCEIRAEDTVVAWAANEAWAAVIAALLNEANVSLNLAALSEQRHKVK